MPLDELRHMAREMETQMRNAAQELEFEKAAQLRDELQELQETISLKEAGISADTPAWEKVRKLEKS